MGLVVICWLFVYLKHAGSQFSRVGKVYPNFNLRKEITLPFLEWDALKSFFTLSQICGWNPANTLTDEGEMSECDHSLQNHLSLNYITDSWRQRWHRLNQHCAVRGKMDGFSSLSRLFMTEVEFARRSRLRIHWAEWMNFVPDWNGSFRTQKEKMLIFCWAVWSYFLSFVLCKLKHWFSVMY